jgi:phage/plasmid-associated DNA primase
MNSVLSNTLANSAESVTHKFNLSCPDGVATAVQDLMTLGFGPLPVAPAQDPHEYPLKKGGKVVYQADGVTPKPLFNGKNPSYIARNGKPRTVAHTRYRSNLPTTAELETWFRDPSVGLGTNGGCWLDFDLKNFDSPEHLDQTVAPIIDRAAWVERTQSGGYRVAVALGEKPEFTNFGLGDVAHAGELRFDGGFVVLAPTVGEHGEYKRLKFGEPLKVVTVQELGIYPSKPARATTEPPAPTPLPDPPRPVAPTPSGGGLRLEPFASKKIAAIIQGKFTNDKSDDLVKVARELYGWENIARAEGIAVDSADSVIYAVAEAAGVADKLERVLKGINRQECEPGLALAQSPEACQNRLRKAAGKVAKEARKASQQTQDIQLDSEDTPGLVAFKYLYENEDYVRIGDDSYKWVGTHFERQDERAEKKRISGVLKRCVKESFNDKDGVIITRPFATAAKRNDAHQWCLSEVPFIQPDQVNPPGVNLKNGVLTFEYGPTGPRPKLLEHSPERVYTYAPQVAYHPEADDTHCRRLLEAISPSYRAAVLRVFAAALDLEAVRKAKGRVVRGLLFSGSGANGKDALREAFTYIFGKSGITSCTIDDFHSYDQGRKFNLASLVQSRINWASENRMGVNIDDIQSLKQLITGDPLITEEKFQQGQEFTPRCVAIFSSNDRAINLTASLEAIATRYAIVPFTKTFKTNPKGPNELKADSRFKYDLDWVKAEVCPAMLNILIEEFQNIFAEGIDYSPFDAGMEENRVEANHLYRFSLDCGLAEDPDSWVSNAELETKLRSWYIEEGILRIDSDTGREKWEDDVRVGDPWVKGAQQYKRRFQKIFPNIDSYRTKDVRGIKGLKFVDPAEIALLECQTWGEYCRANQLHGDQAIKAAWGKLPLDQQTRLATLQPDITTPPLGSEPEPLPEDLVQAEVAILAEAAEAGEVEAMEHFSSLPEPHKRQIWSAITPEIIPKVKELAITYKNATSRDNQSG